jgi:hypothetical protein
LEDSKKTRTHVLLLKKKIGEKIEEKFGQKGKNLDRKEKFEEKNLKGKTWTGKNLIERKNLDRKKFDKARTSKK